MYTFLSCTNDIRTLLVRRKDFCLSPFPRVPFPYSSVFITFFVLVLNVAPAFSQQAADRIFFNAKVFTGEPQNPYATAVAIHGDEIVAVGNLLEVAKGAPANAEHVDLQGKSLFPGFIDSHSHSIDGGMNRISADASENVKTMSQLVAFMANAKVSGKGMNGDILEIFGLPLEFWSHTDQLNANFSAGAYANLPVVLFGMDGHTGWANSAMRKRAGIDSAYVKKLSEQARSYYGVGKNLEPNGFLVDAGMEKLTPLLPKPSDEKLLAAGRAALAYNYSLGITAWLDPLAGEGVLKAYKLLADHGELNSIVDAFPQVFAKDPTAELAAVQKTREQYKGIVNLHITGIKIFADGVVEYPSQTANLTKPYKNTGRNGELLFRAEKVRRVVRRRRQARLDHSRARPWRRRGKSRP